MERNKLEEALWWSDLQTIKQICKTQPDLVKSINKDGDPPLHSYLKSGYTPTLEIVTCLIQQGAPVALQNKDGDTPLHVHLRSLYPTSEIVTCLIQHGAPVALQNKILIYKIYKDISTMAEAASEKSVRVKRKTEKGAEYEKE
ncbi:uncharacterized protein [Antedon mediterranea]|uniref:uncharacterized protein n=1 Tax=Antedon mediterranea TaxID=105859 RepID=UPI003AF902F9